MKKPLLLFVSSFAFGLIFTGQLLANPADKESLRQEIERLTVILSRPHMHNLQDPSTGQSVYEILSAQKILKQRQLEILELGDKIEGIKKILKDNPSWLHRMADLDGRSAQEALTSELAAAQNKRDLLIKAAAVEAQN